MAMTMHHCQPRAKPACAGRSSARRARCLQLHPGNVSNAGKPRSQDRANALDYEGPLCAGTTQDPFPSTTVYVIAKFVDPAARHYDPATKTYIVGPVVSTVYYQFAGTPQRPAGGGGGTVGSRGRLFAGVLTGASWPVGSMTNSFNPGFHFEGFPRYGFRSRRANLREEP